MNNERRIILNGSMQYIIRQSAEKLQQTLLEHYGDDYCPPHGQETNKLAYLLTHTPKEYLRNYGAEEIDELAVQDCMSELSVSLPDEIFDILRRHNFECREYEKTLSHFQSRKNVERFRSSSL